MASHTHPLPQVSVELSACRAEDADAVFAELARLFEQSEESEPRQTAREQHGGRVWSAEFGVTDEWPLPRRVTLHGPVDAELQGAPHAVRSVERALQDVFAVRPDTDVAGDQEEQTRLRLENA